MYAEPTDVHRDEDEIYRLLENEENEEVYRMREKRMHQLKNELTQLDQMKRFNHGVYESLKTEKSAMSLTTSIKFCVIHFHHASFRRCEIIDKKKLSKKHFKTKFARIDVDDAPFLVERMRIQVLPCVISFIDGVAVDKIIGFERLGGGDDFATSTLEDLLEKAGSIAVSGLSDKARKSIFGFQDETKEEDE